MQILNRKNRIFVSVAFSLMGVFFGFSEVYASETVGSIDPVFSSTKVCFNPNCSSFQTVNFTPSNGAPVVVTDSAITGDIWFQESSWASLNPPNGGVTNTSEGVLGGMAWGQAASWINFTPSNGGVTINSRGEFAGYAWVSGISGGWMKFDCGDATTCIKTDWRPVSARSVAPPIINNDNNNNVGGGGGGPIGIVLPVKNNEVVSPTTTLSGGVEEDNVDDSSLFSIIKYYFTNKNSKDSVANVSNVDVRARGDLKNTFEVTGVNPTLEGGIDNKINSSTEGEEGDNKREWLIWAIFGSVLLGLVFLNKNNFKGVKVER